MLAMQSAASCRYRASFVFPRAPGAPFSQAKSISCVDAEAYANEFFAPKNCRKPSRAGCFPQKAVLPPRQIG
jgi:hypothetical protein